MGCWVDFQYEGFLVESGLQCREGYTGFLKGQRKPTVVFNN